METIPARPTPRRRRTSGDRLDGHIHICVPASWLERIEARAMARGLNFSATVRLLLADAMERQQL